MQAQTRPGTTKQSAEVVLGQPVVAAVSEPREQRWGFCQFPALARLPDGAILLVWADADDASETHGHPAPALVSRDDGRTWQPFTGSPRPLRPHYSVSEVLDGEFLTVPAHPYLNIKKEGVRLPAPAAEAKVYGIVRSYRVADMPPAVRNYIHQLPAMRWTPATGQWKDEIVTYDQRNQLASLREGSEVITRSFFEHYLLARGRELLYADYRVRYALDDGTVPPKAATHLMVSTDNGRTFQRRATIAADTSGADQYGEPHLAPTADGRLVCVMRKTDQQQKPMAISWSADGGKTWTPARELFEFGVWPCLLLLQSGTLVLSYGRPGVHLRLDRGGTGEKWSEPIALVKGDAANIQAHTCGYTSLLPLDDRSFLIAYSDFKHRDPERVQRKAILVRRVTVK